MIRTQGDMKIKWMGGLVQTYEEEEKEGECNIDDYANMKEVVMMIDKIEQWP